MRIVIAPDSFKGTLTSTAAAESIKKGVLRAVNTARCVLRPMADGGEGTTDVLLQWATGAKMVEIDTVDAHGTNIVASYVRLDERTAAIDIASASGHRFISCALGGADHALAASTFGTGLMIAAALGAGVQKLYLTLGGSATTDGGFGLLAALGAKYFDADGQLLNGRDARNLGKVAAVDMTGLHLRLSTTEVQLLVDVDNVLCGPSGSAYVFGHQKGLRDEDQPERDAQLRTFASLLSQCAGHSGDVFAVPGLGAAGGAGLPMYLFANATVQPGAAFVAEVLQLEQAIMEADLVITGEGRSDGQTTRGKVPAFVAQLAKHHGKPCYLVSGSIADGAETLFTEGIEAMIGAAQPEATQEEISEHAAEWLQEAAFVLVREITRPR